MNPLDWTAGPFLALYVLVAGAALLWIYNAGNNLAPLAGGDAAGLDPVQLGYLAGGAGRAMDTALVGLFQAGAAVLEKGDVRFDTSVPVPPAFAPSGTPAATARPAMPPSRAHASASGPSLHGADWCRMTRGCGCSGPGHGACWPCRWRWA